MTKTQYVLSKLIARGGMAEIYLGKGIGEDSFGRVCAIKRILPHHAQDKEFVKMFRDEAHICKRLQHANIVQVFDFTEVENSYALIMEYVEGSDLRSLLGACEQNQVKLSIPMVLYMIACVSRGLQYAHTKVDEVTNEPIGIIHRDISPQNILLSYEGEVKIIDFGIASSDSKMAETSPGVVKGKYAYMSPEQVMAKSLDPRSDVFSLAVVLWECLTMRRLFTGKSEVETIRKVQSCSIPNIIEDPTLGIPRELIAIVKKGLAKDRNKRYSSAGAFEKDLLKLLNMKYPEFMPQDFGIFIKKLLAKKRSEDQLNIKKVLTQTGLSSAQQINGLKPIRDKIHEGKLLETQGNLNRKVHLVFDEKKHNTKLKLAEIPTSTYVKKQKSFYRPSLNKLSGRKKKSKSSNSFVGFMFVAIVLTFSGFYFISNFLTFYKRSLSIEINSNVSSAKVSLNGKLINKGKYTNLPLKLNLKPGTYKVSIKREGYSPKAVTIKGKKGQSIFPEIILEERHKKASLAHVKIISTGKKLSVNVNNGLFTGTTPLKLVLTPGQNHFLRASKESQNLKRNLKCNFYIPIGENLENKEFRIKINFLSKKRKCVTGWK